MLRNKIANILYGYPMETRRSESRPLIPGFEGSDLTPKSTYDENAEARDNIAKVRKVIGFLAKSGSAGITDYIPGGSKPYPEGSSEDKKDTRTGINMGWSRNEAVDPGSDSPEPPLLNQDSGAMP